MRLSARSLATRTPSQSASTQPAHSKPERLLPRLKHLPACLQVVPLLRHLHRLSRDVCDLLVRQACNDQRGDDVRRERADEVALDDLLGNGPDEVLELVL